MNVNYVEFFGIPASGKSTIYNKIATNNDDLISYEYALNKSTKNYYTGEQRKSKLKKIVKLIIYSVTNRFIWPVFSYPNCQIKHYSHFKLRNEEIYKRVVDLFRKKELCHDEKVDVYHRVVSLWGGYELIKKHFGNINKHKLLIDEGFVRRSLDIWLRDDKFTLDCQEIEMINGYLEVIPLPEKIIYIKCSPEKSLARMENRGGYISALKKFTYKEKIEKLSYLNSFCDETIEILKNKNIDVIELNNNSRLKDAIIKIKESELFKN